MNLTPQGLQIIQEIAQRYAVSVDAVMTLLQALVNGGGTMAQFSHPEFGGSGQWMQGGMTMVGDMFNNNLKAKVDNLCYELSSLLASQPHQPLFAQASQSQTQGQGGYGQVSLFVDSRSAGGQWWPADLGTPSSTGAQNNIRYAIFPVARRLVIELNGQMSIYDTLDHQIGGVSQQQGGDATLTFTSQFGLVRVCDLPLVQGYAPPPTTPVASAPLSQPAFIEPKTVRSPESAEENDIFGKIERLAGLRQKGILSEEEFSSKKAELLARL